MTDSESLTIYCAAGHVDEVTEGVYSTSVQAGLQLPHLLCPLLNSSMIFLVHT